MVISQLYRASAQRGESLVIVSFIISVLVAFLYRKRVVRQRERLALSLKRLEDAEFERYFEPFFKGDQPPSLTKILMEQLLTLERTHKDWLLATARLPFGESAKDDLEAAEFRRDLARKRLKRFIYLARLQGFGREVDLLVKDHPLLVR